MLQRIHIALVGGQPMPVYLGIEESNADLIVLIHSAQSKDKALDIAAHYGDATRLVEFDPVDISMILASVRGLLDEYAQDEVIVNITGGTKPWSIAFLIESEKRSNVRLVYVDQNCVFYDYSALQEKTDVKFNPQLSLDMDTIMAYNGQIPESHHLLSEYTEEDRNVVEKIKRIRKRFFVDFNKLTFDFERKSQGRSSYTLKDYSSIEVNRKEPSVHFVFRNHETIVQDVVLRSPNVMRLVFNSGWFEYEVGYLASHWSHAKEVWMNSVYKTEDGRQAKNEIDVIVNTGVKLLMIECKTQIFQPTDIDKFHTAVKNYGGMGCKALFITESVMRRDAYEKCRDSNVISFSLNHYPTLEEAGKALYEKLDNEIININAR